LLVIRFPTVYFVKLFSNIQHIKLVLYFSDSRNLVPLLGNICFALKIINLEHFVFRQKKIVTYYHFQILSYLMQISSH